MNRRMIFRVIGSILQIEAIFLVLSGVVSAIYKENKSLLAFLLSAVIAITVGTLLKTFSKPKTFVIYAKEGFVIVAFAWMLMSLIGALPFVISGDIPSYVDAVFEIVSGFTTTGASIVTSFDGISHGTLFWRSFSHWIGGMGILVFVTAILPSVSERPIHILRAEMPGPTMGKLLPRLKDTAVILYIIYVIMTVILIALLIFGGMPVFDSIIHAFGTAGTGGFGVRADSVSSYSSYLQWVITVFMILFGVNFNIYYLLLIKKIKNFFTSEELWSYIGIILSATAIITVNIFSIYQNFADSLRNSAFQVASIISTTGYSTVDFNNWPTLSKTILIILMFIGGCAGSTAGGIKVSRIVIMFKMIGKEIKHMLHPRAVSSVRFEKRPVDAATTKNIGNYFLIYFVCFFVILLLLSADSITVGTVNNAFETNFSAAAACFNNVGPGLSAVGPLASYAQYSDFSKIVLAFAMLLGRLEIFPLIIALSPSCWSRNK